MCKSIPMAILSKVWKINLISFVVNYAMIFLKKYLECAKGLELDESYKGGKDT